MNSEWKKYPITKKLNGSYLVTIKINNQELPYNVIENDKLGVITFTEVDDYYKTLAKSEQLIEPLIATNINTLNELKAFKLAEVNAWTKNKIIGGFFSNASGEIVKYDSDEDTQTTMNTMYNASKSPDFETNPIYQGLIPVRGFAEGSNVKEKFYLNAAQIQKFMDDLAMHIGTSKQEGWDKQKLLEDATTPEMVENIILE